MALPVIDAVSNSGVKAGVSSFSWNHTVAAGSNLGLVVLLQFRDPTLTDVGASAVSYNAVAMTKLVGSRQTDSGGVNLGAEIWFLPNPATGTHSISVTLNGTNDHAAGEASSWTGIQQSTTPNVTQTGFQANVDTSDPSISLTTTIADCMVFDSVYDETSFDNLTVGAGQTVISAKLGTNGGGDEAASSYESKAVAGAVTMSWSTPGVGAGMDKWISVGVALGPATGTVVVKKLAALGVG